MFTRRVTRQTLMYVSIEARGTRCHTHPPVKVQGLLHTLSCREGVRPALCTRPCCAVAARCTRRMAGPAMGIFDIFIFFTIDYTFIIHKLMILFAHRTEARFTATRRAIHVTFFALFVFVVSKPFLRTTNDAFSIVEESCWHARRALFSGRTKTFKTIAMTTETFFCSVVGIFVSRAFVYTNLESWNIRLGGASASI